jgi:TonB-dependent starch-binding outer membrane protein SusC
MYLNFTEPRCSASGLSGFLLRHPTLRFAMRVSFFYAVVAMGTMPMLLAHSGSSQALDSIHVTVELRNENLKNLFKKIESQTGLLFAYRSRQVEGLDNLTLPKATRSVRATLDLVLEGTTLLYRQVNNSVIIFQQGAEDLPTSMALIDLAKEIKGRVTDLTTNEPMPGVNVLVKGTTTGTSTDSDGRYTLAVPEGTTLVFSFIGYATQEVPVAAQTEINVAMAMDIKSLSEVVVVGYGTQERDEVTGAITKVTAEEMRNMPVTSFNQALQGLVPGLMVSGTGGAPGAAPIVRLRGQSSINASNSPLYVIDGIPLIADDMSQQSGLVGYQGQNPLSLINPNDILSIEVLKDAASTAIYGARAANGVILVTTKKGSASGGTKFSFNALAGQAERWKKLDLLDTRQYLELQREAYRNDGLAVPAAVLGADSVTRTDWQDEVFRKAPLAEYQLSASGGSDKTGFFLSGSYRDEKGIMLNNQLKRGTVRLNVDHKASDKLNLGINLALGREVNDRVADGFAAFNPITNALVAPPNVLPRDAQGNYTVLGLRSTTFNNPTNPLAALNEARNTNTATKAITGLYASYHILPSLVLRANLSYDYNVLKEDSYTPRTVNPFNNGNGTNSFTQVGTYLVEPTLTYDKTLGGGHKLALTGGATVQERATEFNTITANNYPDPSLTTIGSALTISSVRANKVLYSFSSVFGRANYAYRDRYLLSATVRRDGSSRFGPGNRFGNFWAAGAGWNFDREAFLANAKWLSTGKLRVSYGITGNDQIPDFVYIGAFNTNATWNDAGAYRAVQLANPGLKWEQTSKLDIGLDVGLFGNQLTLTADYFVNQTTGLLYSTPQSTVTGFGTIFKNIGEVENKGWEVQMSGNIFSARAFRWRASVNVTHVSNKLTKLLGDAPIVSSYSTANWVLKEGEPISTFWGMHYLGVDPNTGNALYEDVDGSGRATTGDNKVIGRFLPDYYGGLNNTFSYKDITLDVFLQFSEGAHVFNTNRARLLEPIISPGVAMYNQSAEVLGRWQKPGDITDQPRAGTQANQGLNYVRTSSRFVEDASYLRVKNVTLAYQVKVKWLQPLKITKARLYATAQNLFTFTRYSGLDPEVTGLLGATTEQRRLNGVQMGADSGVTPQPRTWIVGVNLEF